MKILLICQDLQLLSCAFMTGIVWFVQKVQYPGFRLVGPSEFARFHQAHCSRISPLVAAGMLTELTTALYLAIAGAGNPFWTINLVLVLLLWGFTGFVSIPLHKRLEAGASMEVIDRLVLTNWPRTALWTGRSLALAWL